MEGLQQSIPKRMGALKNILTIGLLVSVLSSAHLWCGERVFPRAPVWSSFYLNEWAEVALLVLYVVLLLASLFLRKQRLLLCLAITVATVFVLADLNRLQPWFYFYNAMLLVFVFYNGRVDDSNNFTAYFISLQVIFASLYFFAGVNRLGDGGMTEEFNHSIAPMQHMLSERHFLFFMRVGVTIPFLLLFSGLGLIVMPVRYLAISLVVLFHLLLFVMLMPFFGNYNYPLWISQPVFILLALLLFSGKTKQRYFSPSFLLNLPLFYVIVILFWVMPVFSRFGAWPSYLTGDFRNYHTGKHIVDVSDEQYRQLPFYERSFCTPKGNTYELDVNAWCLHELNATYCSDVDLPGNSKAPATRSAEKTTKNNELAIN